MNDHDFVTESEAMKNLVRMAERVGPSAATVLIIGEAGTGKEMLANYMHSISKRSPKPLITLNCGALRETLLESELFGHEKGAFTGAYSRKIGLIEVAHGGTMVLENVDELPPGIQAKLLRFLQEGEAYRLGGKDPYKTDVRLITTTNRDLDAEVVRGNFREDLYYRLNTVILAMPPLRKRMEDFDKLLAKFNVEFNGFPRVNISEDAMKKLKGYEWPGNVRELVNTCETLQVLYRNQPVTVNDLPDKFLNQKPERGYVLIYRADMTLHELEKQYILAALQHHNDDKARAAQALGITLKTLYNKLYEYGVL